MRWPTGADVTALRQRGRNYSKFYLGVQRGKDRTSGCLASGAAGTFYVGCHYEINAGSGDAYDNAEHYFSFGNNLMTIDGSIRVGMTLAVGTLADPYAHGSVRIRSVNIAADRIYVEPNNLFDEGHFAAGDYIHCDGVYRLYRILPRIDNGVVFEDGNPDSAAPGWGLEEGIAFDGAARYGYLDRPVALMGSPRFAWTGEAINLYGWRSHGRGAFVVNTWLWDLDGGVAGGAGINAAGTPAAPVTATWAAAGEYNVTLTVTDDSGKAGNDFYDVPFTQHIAVRPVLVFDRPGGVNPPYTHFEVSSLKGKYGGGWSMNITVHGTADRDEFPDNALVILFCEDWYGGTQRQMGGWYGQEGILFCGYIRGDSVTVDHEKSSVSFEAQTIEQWMKELSIWPANFEAAAAPNRWHEFIDMTCEDILWYLAEFRSTLKNVTDCFFASDIGAQKQVDFLDLTEADLYAQMSDQVGSCFFGELSATRHGSIHLVKHKNMMDLAERGVYGPPIWVFSKPDWHSEIEVGEERMRDSVAQVDFIGFIYDAAGNPLEVYSLSPERQNNFGKIEKVSGILLSEATRPLAQPESNTLAGLYRAWKNIRFPHVRVSAKNNRFLEPATQDYFGIILAATDTLRGLVWESKEFLTVDVSYAIDNEKGSLDVEVTGEASTWGPDGVAGPYPPGLAPDEPPDEPPDYWPLTSVDVDSDPPPWWPVPTGGCVWAVVGLGVATAATGFWVTSDPNASPPTWTALNGGLAGNWLNMRDADAIVDEDGHVTVYAVTQAGVCKLSGCDEDWEQLTLPNPINSAVDDPAPVVGDLDWAAVRINPGDSQTVHVVAFIDDPTVPANWRTWQYVTGNGGLTWTSYQLRGTDKAAALSWLVTLPQTGPDLLDVSEIGERVWIAAGMNWSH